MQTQVDLIGRILAAIIITVAVAAVLLLNENLRVWAPVCWPQQVWSLWWQAWPCSPPCRT
ncbi:hypothetical protein [Nesterenkonia pannonica]|uniref:hypothetical protein n=1 Tax=Nesterenkonia pannonica TaxID=1548602 RepID=UPI002164C752|nr:hypothetical protein [Nesterenkonia pannonica]